MAKEETKLSDIEELIRNNQQEQYISKLEDLCFTLKCAIVDRTLKTPELSTFERYFNKLTDKAGLLYVVGLIHECCCYLYPSTLFDKPVKTHISIDELLTRSLKRKSFFRDFYDEADKHNFTPLTIMYVNALNKEDGKLQLAFKKYMKGLHAIVEPLCIKMGRSLDEFFLLHVDLGVDLPTKMVKLIFDALANMGLLNKDKQTEGDFCAFFGNQISAVEKPIVWKDFNKKNRSPNYASLLEVMKTMGVDINEESKKHICSVFLSYDNNRIEPENLKSREDSNHLKEVRDCVIKAIDLYKANL